MTHSRKMKRNKVFPIFNLKSYMIVMLFLGLHFVAQAQISPTNGIVYVTPTGTGNGSSWTNATSNLQGAIDATGVAQVFVAIGNYTVGSSSFVMKNNVAIYGGFDPDNGIDSLTDERIILNRQGSGTGSILNGNNSKPVIWNYATGLTNTAILDGFTITNGRNPSGNGAGIHNRDVSPTLRNLIITSNVCYYSGNGAAMYNYNSSPIINNCYITNNNAADTCGGLFNTAGSAPVLTNVLFFGNSGDIDASTAIYCQSGTITCNNVTMGQNVNYWTQPSITIEGGSMVFNNSIIWGILYNYATYTKSHSIIKFLSDTTNGNIDATGIDVKDIFVDPVNNNYQLRGGMSPLIDAGLNALFPGLSGSTLDLQGANRVQGSTIDLGALEYTPLSTDANGIVYVKDTATGTGLGDSWTNATSRFQDAIDLYGNHQVWVSKGIYYADKKSFILRNGVSILGGFDPDNGIIDTSDVRILPNPDNNLGSVLDGMNQRPVVWNDDNGLNGSAVLDGFTLTKGIGTNGGGVYNYKASPTLRYLVLKNNTAYTSGGGIYNSQSSPAISNTVFTNNSATNGGGMYCYVSSYPNVSNCIFKNNSANYGGAIYHWSPNGVFSNTIIKQNTANSGAGLYLRAATTGVKFNNLLIAENTAADSQSSAIFSALSIPVFTNITIAGNAANAVYNASSPVNKITFNNAVLFGGVSGSNNLNYSLLEGSADTSNGNLNGVGVTPADVFKNPTTGDYTLKSTTTAINAGNNTLFTGLDSTTKDLAGNPRLSGPRIDLGAYEFPIVVTPDVNGIVYVCDTARGLGNGDSWANATDSLQAAINATGTQKVYVAIGNYNVPSPHSFVMKNNVEIYGGFDPDNGIDSLSDTRILPNQGVSEGSVLNGKNERPVIFNDNNGVTATAVLNGFTIKNGLNIGSSGGGIYNNNVSPVFANLVITQNAANVGGGMYNLNTNVQLSNILFENNSANYGGALYNNGKKGGLSSVLTNVRFSNNEATMSTSGSGGGGIFNQNADMQMTNALFINNTTNFQGGAIRSLSGNPVLTNVTIANNTATLSSSNAMDIAGGILQINNSIVYGSILGAYTPMYSLIESNTDFTNGNIDATGITLTDIFINPSADFYFLKKGTHVVNAGSNALYAGLSSTTKDLLGMPRLYGTTIDMGAYEYNLLPNANGTIYVKDTATGIGNGTSWEDATDDLHNAIHTTDVQKVFVAIGNYNVGSSSFIMKNNVAIYGGFDPDNGIDSLGDTRIMMDTSGATGSILNGQNARPVFWNVFTSGTALDTSAVLNGFTITGGAGVGNQIFFDGGGGMRNSYASPTISNTVFRNNTAFQGGGMLNHFSGPVISNTAFIGNTASSAGGGIMNYSSASTQMDNCLIVGNSAPNGGGISNRYTGTQTFRNMRIIKNKSTTVAGGVENVSSTSTFINSEISGNALSVYTSGTNAFTLINTTVVGNYNPSFQEIGIYTVGGNAIYKNTIIFGQANGNGTFTASHSFIQNSSDTTNGNIDATGITKAMVFSEPGLEIYTLKSGSPVINKGDSSFFPNLNSNTKDLAGRQRVIGQNIDLGAYEYFSNNPTPIKLLAFTAEKQQEDALLKWSTAMEQNNQGFELQHSADSRNWETLTFVLSKAEDGNSQQRLDYNYLHLHPGAGNNFYRLKQIDVDGHSDYSVVRMLNFDGAMSINIFPNPTQEQITITGLEEGTQINISNSLGQIIKSIPNSQAQEIISLNGLVSGMYYVSILSNNNQIATFKIIKGK